MSADIPTVVHTGTLDLSGFKLRCHVLSNGERVFPEEDVVAFFAWLEGGAELTREDADRFARFVKGVEEPNGGTA